MDAPKQSSQLGCIKAPSLSAIEKPKDGGDLPHHKYRCGIPPENNGHYHCGGPSVSMLIEAS